MTFNVSVNGEAKRTIEAHSYDAALLIAVKLYGLEADVTLKD